MKKFVALSPISPIFPPDPGESFVFIVFHIEISILCAIFTDISLGLGFLVLGLTDIGHMFSGRGFPWMLVLPFRGIQTFIKTK